MADILQDAEVKRGLWIWSKSNQREQNAALREIIYNLIVKLWIYNRST